MALKMSEENERTSAPHNVGIKPPTEDPTNMPIQMNFFVFIPEVSQKGTVSNFPHIQIPSATICSDNISPALAPLFSQGQYIL